MSLYRTKPLHPSDQYISQQCVHTARVCIGSIEGVRKRCYCFIDHSFWQINKCYACTFPAISVAVSSFE